MPITVRHSPDAALIGQNSYNAGLLSALDRERTRALNEQLARDQMSLNAGLQQQQIAANLYSQNQAQQAALQRQQLVNQSYAAGDARRLESEMLLNNQKAAIDFAKQEYAQRINQQDAYEGFMLEQRQNLAERQEQYLQNGYVYSPEQQQEIQAIQSKKQEVMRSEDYSPREKMQFLSMLGAREMAVVPSAPKPPSIQEQMEMVGVEGYEGFQLPMFRNEKGEPEVMRNIPSQQMFEEWASKQPGYVSPEQEKLLGEIMKTVIGMYQPALDDTGAVGEMNTDAAMKAAKDMAKGMGQVRKALMGIEEPPQEGVGGPAPQMPPYVNDDPIYKKVQNIVGEDWDKQTDKDIQDARKQLKSEAGRKDYTPAPDEIYERVRQIQAARRPVAPLRPEGMTYPEAPPAPQGPSAPQALQAPQTEVARAQGQPNKQSMFSVWDAIQGVNQGGTAAATELQPQIPQPSHMQRAQLAKEYPSLPEEKKARIGDLVKKLDKALNEGQAALANELYAKIDAILQGAR